MPATGGLESHPVNTIHRYTVFSCQFMTSDYGNFHLQIKVQMKFLSSQTQVLAHLAIRRSAALTRHMHQHIETSDDWSCHSTCGSMQPTQKFLVQHHFSCIPITQLQWSLLFSSHDDVTIFYHASARSMEQNPCHMNCSSLFMRCDENMIFICVIQNYMVFIHDSHQPNIHPFNLTSIHSTHRLPVSDCISEVRPPTARRLTRSNERPTDVALEPRRELRWIQPLARLQALIPRGNDNEVTLVTPKKNANRLCQSSSNMRKPAIQPQKKCIHWFICIHHHSSIIEATLNHSTVVASIHLTSSIPEMPAAHQETWCKSQPVKYHPKVETFEDFPFFPILSLCCLGEFAFSKVMMTAEEHSKSGHHHGPGS